MTIDKIKSVYWLASLLAAVGLLVPGVAWAVVYGNPVPSIGVNESGLGASLSDKRKTLFLDYGHTGQGVIQLLLGTVEAGPADGTEIGAGYRYKFDEELNAGDYTINMGAFGIFRYGMIGGGTFYQVDIGVGGSMTPIDRIRLFAAPVVRLVQTSGGGGRGKGNSSDTDVGVFGGVEYSPNDEVILGVQLNLGLGGEDFGVYGEIKF